jgi:hypothetical protein
VLAWVEQAADDAGALLDGTYKYYVSLYDSVRELWGERSALALKAIVSLGGVGHKMWLHAYAGSWNSIGNYDYENAHADRLKVWRNRTRTHPPPTPNTDDDLFLAGTMRKGLIVSSAADISIGGVLTDNTVSFGLTGDNPLNVVAGDAVWINETNWRQVSSVTEHTLTLLDDDGSAYADGEYTDTPYQVWGGFIDEEDDLSAEERYHGELDVPEDHNPPERCSLCEVFGDKGNRVFMAGDAGHPNRLYYSEIDLVDYWPLANWIDIDPDDSDEITAIIKFRKRLWMFKRNSLAVGYVDGDPYTWAFGAKVLSMGTASRRTVADCGSHLVFANPAGIWAFDGESKPMLISHPKEGSNIKKLWENVVKAELIRSQAVYNAEKNEFWISVAFDDARGMFTPRDPKGTITHSDGGT